MNEEDQVIFFQDCAMRLQRAGLDSFHAIFNAPGEFVDRNRNRDVLRLTMPKTSAVPYLKRFHAARGVSGFSKAQDEYRRIERFQAAGFSGPNCAALGGSGTKSGNAFLLFLENSRSVTLSDSLRHTPPELCRGLILQVADTLGKIHRSGIRMPDLMARHVQVRADGSFYFIDLARLAFGRHGAGSAARDLAGLSATIESQCLSRAMRMRFLLAYLKSRGRPCDRGGLRRLWRRVSRRERRAHKKGRFPDLIVLKQLQDKQEGFCYLNSVFEEAVRRIGLETVRDFFLPASTGVLLRDVGERRNYSFTDGETAYFLKIHRDKKKARGGSHGRKEWNNHLHLMSLGIPVPVPVAWGEGSGCSFFMSKKLEGETGDHSVAQWTRRSFNSRKQVLIDLAAYVSRLHRCGLYHRELYLCHLVISDQDVHLIDLQRLSGRKLFRGHLRIKDLAALLYSSLGTQVTRSERLRFLRAYTGGSRLNSTIRRLIRAVENKAKRIARHVAGKQNCKGS